MLGVVHEGIAFPLLWTLLDKRGNSNSDERMDLLERFEALFPDAAVAERDVSRIAYLTADRELIGKEWLSYLLLDKPIPKGIRIRQTDLICSGSRQSAMAGCRYFAHLSVGETRVLSGRHWVWGRPVHVVATRLRPTQNSDHDFLIVITHHSPQQALSD